MSTQDHLFVVVFSAIAELFVHIGVFMGVVISIRSFVGSNARFRSSYHPYIRKHYSLITYVLHLLNFSDSDPVDYCVCAYTFAGYDSVD